MKKFYSIILLAVVFIACEKSDITKEKDYLSSYEAWLKFKVESNNSYRYISTTSSWTGTATETTITVQDGRITGRDFVRTKVNSDTNEVEVVEQWQENEENLNTHENYGTILKLDEIYHLAETEWLKKQKGVQTYLETNNNGMISSCGYVPAGCQDDCFIGINIKSIEKL